MQPVAGRYYLSDFAHGADDLQSLWSQIRVMRVTAHADHGHFDLTPQSAYVGLSLAIRVHGMYRGPP